MKPPLTATTIVSLESGLALSLATRYLAELGARVIKVCCPQDQQDPLRCAYPGVQTHPFTSAWVDRGKQSVEVAPDDELLQRLILGADVLLCEVPGIVAAAGVDLEELRQANPRLIVGSVTAYGSDGPNKDRAGYDLLVQAEAGVLAGADGASFPPALPVADLACAMQTVSGVLSALLASERSGEGSSFRVSQFDALVDWMGPAIAQASSEESAPDRTTTSGEPLYPYGPFETGNDVTIFIAVLTAGDWERFCRLVLDRPDLVREERFASPASRFDNRAELDVLIGTSFSRLSGVELVERLEDAGIAYGQPRRVARVANHSELRARRRWLEVRADGVQVQLPATPVVSTAFDPIVGDTPARGSATEAIRVEFSDGR